MALVRSGCPMRCAMWQGTRCRFRHQLNRRFHMSGTLTLDCETRRVPLQGRQGLMLGLAFAFGAFGVLGYAQDLDNPETLAGVVIEEEVEYGCPVEYPFPKFTVPGTFPDANRDGVICV